ncbi:hypothetical protein N7452_000791 [Penicillium brevicompactum]|uniref:DNA repair protein Dds20/Sfr1 n=1 Tax=Penicillium brevicompactum TaxID=5074 RepID=A0A9W9R147_PENBR|nr:hypothetical protein N7452_000791 [Penicillium brevicompactum]
MAQPTKRRRIDPAATLSKPFKSPLRRPVPSTDAQPSTPTPKTDVPIPSIPQELSKEKTSSTPETPIPAKRKSILSPLPRTPKSFQAADPDIIALQKQQRAIQSRLAALRSELDQANQALRLETSDKDTELETLIVKWRLISQNAADEAFTSAEERVKRMGGMTAWKEQSKRDSTRWEFDEEKREVEHVDDEIDPREIEVPDDQGTAVNEDTDEEFTMEFMLKTLHIDPKLIGYDTKAQRWIKTVAS